MERGLEQKLRVADPERCVSLARLWGALQGVVSLAFRLT